MHSNKPLHSYRVLTPAQAKAECYVRITNDYNLPWDQDMLERAVSQLGDADIVLVQINPERIVIGRRGGLAETHGDDGWDFRIGLAQMV